MLNEAIKYSKILNVDPAELLFDDLQTHVWGKVDLLKTNELEIMRLIIHEFGHYYSSDHLSKNYYDGLCKIGAKLYCNK